MVGSEAKSSQKDRTIQPRFDNVFPHNFGKITVFIEWDICTELGNKLTTYFKAILGIIVIYNGSRSCIQNLETILRKLVDYEEALSSNPIPKISQSFQSWPPRVKTKVSIEQFRYVPECNWVKTEEFTWRKKQIRALKYKQITLVTNCYK